MQKSNEILLWINTYIHYYFVLNTTLAEHLPRRWHVYLAVWGNSLKELSEATPQASSIVIFARWCSSIEQANTLSIQCGKHLFAAEIHTSTWKSVIFDQRRSHRHVRVGLVWLVSESHTEQHHLLHQSIFYKIHTINITQLWIFLWVYGMSYVLLS